MLSNGHNKASFAPLMGTEFCTFHYLLFYFTYLHIFHIHLHILRIYYFGMNIPIVP